MAQNLAQAQALALELQEGMNGTYLGMGGITIFFFFRKEDKI